MVNIILAILSTYLIYEYYKTFFDIHKTRIISKIFLSIYCIWQVLSLAVVNIPAWFRLILSILFVLLTSFCFVGEIWGKVIFAIIYNTVWMLSELLIGAVFLVAGLSITEYGELGSVLSKLLLLGMVKLLQYFFLHDSVNIFSWKENAMLMVIPVCSMFFSHHLFTLTYKAGTANDIVISFAAFIAILSMNLMFFRILIKLSESLEIRRENSIFQLEIDLFNKHIAEKENAMEEFRKSKHDLKHKLLYARQLLIEEKYTELEDYIGELIDLRTLEGFTIAHSQNSLIDALINYKYETAKQNGIRFEVKLDIPTIFPLANADLCIILGNALDNAIEANIDKGIVEPYVDLKMKYTQKNLVLIIENSFNGELYTDGKGNVITRKNDKKNHGIGIKSIQRALQKYNGFMNVDIDNKNYKLTIIMYM